MTNAMKHTLAYLSAGLCLMLGACSEESTEPASGSQTGTLEMSISTTRAEAGDTAYDPLDDLAVRIYNEEGGLLRKYTSTENIPEKLTLIAGTYRVDVEAGKARETSFTERFYKGSETFVVPAGGTVPVEVVCKLQNTVVAVKFDQTVIDNFQPGYSARVAADAPYDEDEVLAGSVPSLKYTTDAEGYFILSEGVKEMSWKFQGTHTERGEIAQTGTISGAADGSGLKAGGKYTLTFRFSKDLPGYIEALLIEVDPSTDDWDDTIIFSPDPTIKGDGFSIAELQRHTTGEWNFDIATVAEMATVTMQIDGIGYTLFDAANPADVVDGVATTSSGTQNLRVTFSDALFAGRTAGDHPISLTVTDKDGGVLTATTTFRLQGLLPISASDYNLWANTLTMRAVSFDHSAEASVTLTDAAGGSQTARALPDGNDYCTLRFAPEWESSTNTQGKTVYSLKAGTGLRAGQLYSYTAQLGETVLSGTLDLTATGDRIPDGDLENSSLPCFTLDCENTPFWGSGNNSQAASLCLQATAGDGTHYAKLQSTAAGMAGIYSLAAGNLFTGTFIMSSTTGTVGFGQKYTYTARPTALRLKYRSQVGPVNYNLANGPLSEGAQDKARIYAAIVDWSERHKVASKFAIVGTSTCSGSWDPENGANSVSEGKVLGYASLWIDWTTEGEAFVTTGDELKIYWYDTEAAAPTGNYTLVLNCSANAYGDFFNGCSTNFLMVDDFEWVY